MSRIGAIDVDRLLDRLTTDEFSGVIHVAGDEGEPPILIVLGLADRAAGIANTAATRFGVASVSKLLTGMTVARLVDAGEVAWDARYVDLVPPGLRPQALDPRVTLEHLLTHSSGFGDYFDEDGDESYETIWTRTPSTLIRGPRDMMPLLIDLPQLAEPGSIARYNDGEFVLIGIAIEALTGRSYPDVVRRRVFEPLGMDDSGFWPLDGVEPRLAVGYLPPDPAAAPDSPSAAWRTNVYAMPAMGGPDGGAQSTASDLVRLLDGLTGRSGPGDFLADATRAHLIGPHAADADEFFRFGCGVLHVGEAASARFGHTGEDPGASARVWSYPRSGERVVVVSNVTEGSGAITRHLDALLAEA